MLAELNDLNLTLSIAQIIKDFDLLDRILPLLPSQNLSRQLIRAPLTDGAAVVAIYLILRQKYDTRESQ